MSSQLQVSGEAKIRAIQGPVVANSGVITALNGGATQYVRGDGTLADFPTSTGGGSSVSYYLNSSVSQGTIGGVAYRQLGKTPISGAGTDIAISTTGYVASYITDANDPALLEVPAGNFNCEFYFSVNNDTGNPFVYAEVYKYDGTTFTLLGTSTGVPEYITEGTVINPYYFAVPVAVAALTVTDRIAIRIYVNVDGRTVTLHTENNHLCQVVTTFSKGLISLNNLTRQNQFFGTGTSGTDFAIVSSVATHTFNLPVASAANTGKLSSTDWSTFNAKQPAGNYVTIDTTQTITGTKTFNEAIRNESGLLLKNGVLSGLAGYTSLGGSVSNGLVVQLSGSANMQTLIFQSAAAYSYTLPAATGTIALTSDILYPVTSVFGRTGVVVATSGDYTTTQVTEGTNLYFTDARSRGALSFVAGSGAYNSTTGVITIPTNNTQITNGSNYITLTSLSGSTGISYNNTTGAISSTITQYTDALARAAISLTTTGTSGAATYNNTTGVLNIPQYIGGVTSVFGRTGAVVATEGDYSLTQLSDVTITTPSTGQVLKYNGTAWINDTDANSGTVTSVAALTLGTTGTDLSSSVATGTTTPVITLNVPTASAANRGALSSADWTTFNGKESVLTFSSPLVRTTNTISIPVATTSVNGYLSSTDWTTFNGKQGAITLTTTGTSGAATLIGNTLNIPQYSGGGGGSISLAAIGSTPNANAATLTGTVLNLEPASASFGGVVTTGTQTFAGAKTFSSNLQVNSFQIINGITAGTSTYLQFSNNASPIGYIGSAAAIVTSGSASDYALSTTQNIVFATSGGFTERMRITSGGSVGINTITIGSQLQVNGSAAIGYSASTAAPTNGLLVAGVIQSANTYGWTIGELSGAARVQHASGLFTFLTTANQYASVEGLGLRASGSSAFGSSGVGVEIGYSGGLGYIQAYSRTSSLYQPIKVDGSTVSLQISGVEKLGITSGGNVGIGVTPSAWDSTYFRVLDIGSANSRATFYGRTDTTKEAGISVNSFYSTTGFKYVNNGAATLMAFSDGTFQLNTAAVGTANAAITFTTAMYMNTSANFGIGTTTIGSKLQVNGNAAIGYSASTAAPTNGLAVSDSILVNATTQNGTAAKIYAKQSSDASFRGINIVSAAAAEFVGGMYIDGSGNFNIAQSYLGAGSYQALTFLTGGTTRLTIASTGAATFSSSVAASSSTNGEQTLSNTNTSTGTSAVSVLNLQNNTSVAQFVYNSSTYAGGTYGSGANGLSIINRAAGNISFMTQGYTDAQCRLRIESGGNIGINTITIGSKLQVNGNAAIGYSASTAAPTNGLVVAGNVLVGTTSENSYGATVTSVQLNGVSGSLYETRHNGTSGLRVGSSSDHCYIHEPRNVDMRFSTFDTLRMTISGGGVVTIANLAGTGSRAVIADASGVLSAPVSDISVKQNITAIGYGLKEISKMNPVWFDYTDEYKNYGEGRQNGNIAQEMAEIIPEAVFTTPSTGKMGINYDQMHAVYIKAIQELEERIKQLEKQLK